LRSGHIITTAIEGTRGRGYKQLKIKTAKPGLIFLATHFEKPLPIISIAVWGQNELTFPIIDFKGFKFKDLKNLRKEPLHIKIGKPFIPVLDVSEETC